jgi:uncharacterized OB-fold protein
MDLGWFQTISTGVIHSYVLVEQPMVGAFISSVPYVVAIIELDDCKQEDGTVTRVAGVLTDDHSKPANGWNFDDYEAGVLVQFHSTSVPLVQ